MTFLTDFRDALVNYPDTGVTITIEDLAEHGGNGTQVNTNEIWQFTVKVHNRGWADMRNISVTVDGDNGATVGRTPSGPWYNMIDVDVPDLNSWQAGKTDVLYFKAPGKPSGVVQLIESHLADWDAGIATLLAREAGHSELERGIFNSEVLGN